MGDFSRFIREAGDDEKAEVYGEVMDAATCRQALSLLVDALGDFDGMDEPPQGFNLKLDRLRVAFRMGRDALTTRSTPTTGDGCE